MINETDYRYLKNFKYFSGYIKSSLKPHFGNDSLAKKRIQLFIKQLDGKDIPINEYVSEDSIRRLKASNFLIGNFSKIKIKKIKIAELEQIYKSISTDARKIDAIYKRTLNYVLNEKVIYESKRSKGYIFKTLITEANSNFITELNFNTNLLKKLTPPPNLENSEYLQELQKESINTCEMAMTDISNLSSSIHDNPEVWATNFEAPLSLPVGAVEIDILNTIPAFFF